MDLEQITSSVTMKFAPVFQALGPWNASLGDARTALAILVPSEVTMLWLHSQGESLLPAMVCSTIYAWAMTGNKRASYSFFEEEVKEHGWSADLCRRYKGIAEIWAEAHGQMDEYRRARR